MERESNPMQALCRSGCGFYGSPATDGLCSLCFKENLKKKQQLPNTPSLTSLRETTTAQPTISHIPSSPITDLPTDFLVKIHRQMSSSNRPYPSSSPQASENNVREGDNVEKIDMDRKSPNPDGNNVTPISNGDSLLFCRTSANESKNSRTEIGVAMNNLCEKKSELVDISISERPQVRPNRQLRQVGRCFTERQNRRDKRKASEECSNAAQAAGNAAAETIAAEAAAAASASDADTSGDDKDGDKDVKKKKNRCATCRKKVGLTGFECRCGGLFCAIHRYSDKHDCSFNYREMGAQEIRRNNPVVVGEKIQKI